MICEVTTCTKSVYLSSDTHDRLVRVAEERGVSVYALIKEAIEVHLGASSGSEVK